MGCMRYFDSDDMSMDLHPAGFGFGDNPDYGFGVDTFQVDSAFRMMQYERMRVVVISMTVFSYREILNRLHAFRVIWADAHVSFVPKGPSNVDRIELKVSFRPTRGDLQHRTH